MRSETGTACSAVIVETANGDFRVVLDGYIATATINRPPNNYFDVELITALADALDELSTKTDCRVVVLESNGRNFCAGANFAAPRSASTGPHLYEVALRLFEQPLPVVASIQGAAVGGGLGLALAADFRIAAHEAKFAANFSQLGFHQGFGLTVTLPLVVGHQSALDLLYTGRRIRGAEAKALGLCDRLVSLDELPAAAVEFAATIATAAPLAVRSIKKTMRGPTAAAVRSALERELSEQRRLMATHDWKEGVAAAAERRTPEFRGR